MRWSMKNIFLFLSTLALVCFFTGSLFAADDSLEDLKFADGTWVKVDGSSSFVSGISSLKHDLSHPDPISHTYTPGTPWFDKNFNPATQVIKEASLDLYMRDTFSVDPDDPSPGSDDEYARLFIEGVPCLEDYEIDNGGYLYLGWSKYTYTLTPLMIDLLDQDGELDFTLASRQNDFFFLKSVLNVTVGDKPNPPVPEPATVLLFGFGLLGLAAFRKKMK